MVGRRKIESGFKPRFNPKTTKGGKKRKRNVTFWANLNQKLYEHIIEQANTISTPEKGLNVKELRR